MFVVSIFAGENSYSRVIWYIFHYDYVSLVKEGTTLKDNKFETNVSGANAVGIKTGAYHFVRFGSKSEALAEAKFFLSVVKNVKLSYPLVLDLEVNQRNVSKSVLTDAAVAFLREVEKAGYFAMFYSYKDFLENSLDESKLKPFALWAARYNSILGRMRTSGSILIVERCQAFPGMST
ncbi:GH25 family lysozyme [Bacillus licheniformis]